MKLSIIIPFYNTHEYTGELLATLGRQIHLLENPDDVEVILIDDGSDKPFVNNDEWVRVFRTRRSNPATARNKGLKLAKGDYIQFIDSDDLVSENFISCILEAIENGTDLVEFSWRSLSSGRFDVRLSQGDRCKMPGVVLRAFKRSYIGDTRFNEKKDATEDEDFSRRLGYLTEDVSVTVIPEYMYFYRDDVTGSNVKSYKAGYKHTKRIAYYIPHVEKGCEYIEQIKKDDEENEVILLTEQNDVPELKRYCQIFRPCRMWTHFAKGYRYPFEIISIPIDHQVMLYIQQLNIIGGIETFIYYFARLMKHKDVALVIGNLDESLKRKYERYIRVYDYTTRDKYSCDTLIMLRILDRIPANIEYVQSVQMCHACRTNPAWHIRQTSDFIVNVSEASKKSFGAEAENGIVIHNPIITDNPRALMLVSATRIPAPDKGQNEERMRRLADMLNEAGIPFLWFNFSDGSIPNPPRGMINVGRDEDIRPYIASATYLVQLSDSEAWSYSILEALTQNVPCIVTDFPSAREMGIKDGENGYILPFSMDFDVKRLLKVPKFTYLYDNEPIKRQWERIIDHKIKVKKKKMWDVVILQQYNDISLGRLMHPGETVPMPVERAKVIIDLGYGKVKGDI